MKISNARATFRKEFKKDKGFLYGYQANIALAIYDNQLWNPKEKLNLSDINDCNKMALKLLDLIFSK